MTDPKNGTDVRTIAKRANRRASSRISYLFQRYSCVCVFVFVVRLGAIVCANRNTCTCSKCMASLSCVCCTDAVPSLFGVGARKFAQQVTDVMLCVMCALHVWTLAKLYRPDERRLWASHVKVKGWQTQHDDDEHTHKLTADTLPGRIVTRNVRTPASRGVESRVTH